MIFTFDEIAEMLDDIVDSLPDDITRGLNGGVYLVDALKPHPQLPCPQYVVMGQYIHSPPLGDRIELYYRSIMTKYSNASIQQMQDSLRHIVLHEFRHHMERRAGERDLEIEDAKFVESALRKVSAQS